MQKLQNVSDILIYVKVFLKELPKEKNDYPLELNTDIRCCEPHSGISTAGKQPFCDEQINCQAWNRHEGILPWVKEDQL